MDKLPFGVLPSKISRGIAIVIFSNPGIGKTHLASTLPEGETLIVNTEAGIAPLLGSKHIVWHLQQVMANGKNVEDAMTELYMSIRTKAPGYEFIKNVVLDNVSELSDQLTTHYTKTRGKDFPEIKEHGDTAFKFREWMHDWRDLVELGINVVINAWEQDYDIAVADGLVQTRTCPKVGRANVPSVCGIVDVVGHLENHEKSGQRWIRIAPSKQYLTKCQFKGLEDDKGQVIGQPADLPTLINKIKEYDYSKRSL